MNINGKYKKVWAVDVKDNYVSVNLGDSKKNKDGEYENWTWFNVAFVGNAKEPAKDLQEGDTIEIINGMVSQNKGQDEKWYTNMVVFEFEVMYKAEGGSQPQDTGSDDSGKMPWE